LKEDLDTLKYKMVEQQIFFQDEITRLARISQENEKNKSNTVLEVRKLRQELKAQKVRQE
jgi:hypothetical protein